MNVILNSGHEIYLQTLPCPTFQNYSLLFEISELKYQKMVKYLKNNLRFASIAFKPYMLRDI